MGIYAIRDRLLDHLMAPFIATGDKEVLHSLSTLINDKDTKHAIAQAPHHYEVYKLGTVDEDGTIVARKEFIADAGSLIRSQPANGSVDPTVEGRIPPGREPTGPRSGPVQETSGGVNGAASHT